MSRALLRMREIHPIALAFVVLLSTLSFTRWKLWHGTKVYGGTRVIHGNASDDVLVYERASSWESLFCEAKLSIDCGDATQRSRIYVSDSEERLRERLERHRWSWCGLYRRSGSCQLGVDPTKQVFVLVKRLRALDECKINLEKRFCWKLLISFGIGMLFLTRASSLSHSKTFRLGAGASTVALASAILLLYMIRSRLPRARIAISFALFGTSLSSICRWLYGVWFPRWDEDMLWKALIVYLILGFLGGLAVMHVIDDDRHQKARDVLQVALQLFGALLVAYGLRPWWLALLACVGVVMHKVYVWKVEKTCNRTAVVEASDVLRSPAPPEAYDSALSPNRLTDDKQNFMEESISPLVKRGLILNDSTGKNIKIHGKTYYMLMAKGYQPDLKNGVMSPPRDTERRRSARRRSSISNSHSS